MRYNGTIIHLDPQIKEYLEGKIKILVVPDEWVESITQPKFETVSDGSFVKYFSSKHSPVLQQIHSLLKEWIDSLQIRTPVNMLFTGTFLVVPKSLEYTVRRKGNCFAFLFNADPSNSPTLPPPPAGTLPPPPIDKERILDTLTPGTMNKPKAYIINVLPFMLVPDYSKAFTPTFYKSLPDRADLYKDSLVKTLDNKIFISNSLIKNSMRPLCLTKQDYEYPNHFRDERMFYDGSFLLNLDEEYLKENVVASNYYAAITSVYNKTTGRDRVLGITGDPHMPDYLRDTYGITYDSTIDTKKYTRSVYEYDNTLELENAGFQIIQKHSRDFIGIRSLKEIGTTTRDYSITTPASTSSINLGVFSAGEVEKHIKDPSTATIDLRLGRPLRENEHFKYVPYGPYPAFSSPMFYEVYVVSHTKESTYEYKATETKYLITYYEIPVMQFNNDATYTIPNELYKLEDSTWSVAYDEDRIFYNITDYYTGEDNLYSVSMSIRNEYSKEEFEKTGSNIESCPTSPRFMLNRYKYKHNPFLCYMLDSVSDHKTSKKLSLIELEKERYVKYLGTGSDYEPFPGYGSNNKPFFK